LQHGPVTGTGTGTLGRRRRQGPGGGDVGRTRRGLPQARCSCAPAALDGPRCQVHGQVVVAVFVAARVGNPVPVTKRANEERECGILQVRLGTTIGQDTARSRSFCFLLGVGVGTKMDIIKVFSTAPHLRSFLRSIAILILFVTQKESATMMIVVPGGGTYRNRRDKLMIFYRRGGPDDERRVKAPWRLEEERKMRLAFASTSSSRRCGGRRRERLAFTRS